MRILACGGRGFDNEYLVCRALDHLNDRKGISVLIHGAAPGADRLAGEWAEFNGIKVISFPADWKNLGLIAGPMRNMQMLIEGRPEGVVAFPGGSGTADMVRRAVAAGVKVWRPYG